ncbi:hypothetical protein Vafri_11054 [Volvox africanus]|uniref:Uncharacterized protein n=1 Tax=Volvox africanus TaxID=51714 RepID=A0A8J4F2Y6_9CHLO|nr:hypothetical protein Vafri_11054 [Volvox africanus]
MRRVQSSIYGDYAGAGPTVVLQTASPTAESARFGRRRSSLVFIPCPPETPTRSNSIFKLQRAASSFSSATGWHFSPVGGDDAAHDLADNFKVLQHSFSSPCRSTHDAASLGCDEVTKTGGLENVSCFVSCSSPSREARLYAGYATASPRAPPKSCNPCVTCYYVPDNANGNGGGEDACVGFGEWLGTALADRTEPPPPPSSYRNCTGIAGTLSSGWSQAQEGASAAVAAARAGLRLQSLDIVASGTRAGEVQTRPWGLHRTRRVVRNMDLMSSTDREYIG